MLSRLASTLFASACLACAASALAQSQPQTITNDSVYPAPSRWSAGSGDAPAYSSPSPAPQTIENHTIPRTLPPYSAQQQPANIAPSHREPVGTMVAQEPSYPRTAAPAPATATRPSAPPDQRLIRLMSAEEHENTTDASGAAQQPTNASSPESAENLTDRLSVIPSAPKELPPTTATAMAVPPVAVAPPLAEPAPHEPLRLAPRERSENAAAAARTEPPTPTAAIGTVAGGLAIVLTVFFAVAWFSRRYLPQAAAQLPKEAVEMLGWTPLAGRQQMQLIRVGNKLVLVAVTNTDAKPLAEVTDLHEVERLSALCRRTKPGSSTATFQQTLREFEREPAPGGFVGSAPPEVTVPAAATPARGGRTLGRLAAIAVLIGSCWAAAASAQQPNWSASSSGSGSAANEAVLKQFGALNNSLLTETPADEVTNEAALSELLSGGPEAWATPKRLSSTLQIMLLLTVLSLAPAILLMTTSFVRIIVVLGLLRQALGTQQLPPSQVMTALAMFMTLLVMTPTWREVYNDGIQPYSTGQITNPEDAWKRCAAPIKRFLSRQIELAGNSDDVWLFYDYLPEAQNREKPPETYEEIPLQALLPAFLLSELKTAFLIGFQIYLPFLILDIVVSSVTISMGMMMLPPVMISLPLKLLLFVLVDGWNLVVGMLLESFGAPL